jgi:RNA polymerase sigma factor for flagellar operon FliA
VSDDKSEVDRFGAEDEAREAALWADWRTHARLPAREALFSLYTPFARHLAKRHFLDRASPDIELAELGQLAFAGLLEAIDRFDPAVGAPFRSFAVRRISGSILDGIAHMSEVREQLSFRKRIRQERARSLSEADVEIASPPEAMDALIDLAVGLALGFMVEGSGLYVQEDEPDRRFSAYASLAWKETVQRVLDEISRLPDREALIIRRHYLEGLTFDQIGSLLGVSKGRVSQLHRGAIESLRSRLPAAAEFHLER